MAEILQRLDVELRIPPQKEALYTQVLQRVSNEIITMMKSVSPEFRNLYSRIYYGGSYFDKLKVWTTEAEYDLNIILKFDRNAVVTEDLDGNFADFRLTRNPRGHEEKITERRQDGCYYLCRDKMRGLVELAAERALNQIGNTVDQYRVTRSRGNTPFTLIVRDRDNVIIMEIDLVAAVELSIDTLTNVEARNRLTFIEHIRGARPVTNYLAICVYRKSNKMEVAIKDIEKIILGDLQCAKPIIKIIKVLRDKKGGPFSKIWSYFIKAVVMNVVLKTPAKSDWENCHFVDRLLQVFRFLALSLDLDTGCVPDIMFPEVNLVDRLKRNRQPVLDIRGYFHSLIRKLEGADKLEVQNILVNEIRKSDVDAALADVQAKPAGDDSGYCNLL